MKMENVFSLNTTLQPKVVIYMIPFPPANNKNEKVACQVSKLVMIS